MKAKSVYKHKNLNFFENIQEMDNSVDDLKDEINRCWEAMTLRKAIDSKLYQPLKKVSLIILIKILAIHCIRETPRSARNRIYKKVFRYGRIT